MIHNGNKFINKKQCKHKLCYNWWINATPFLPSIKLKHSEEVFTYNLTNTILLLPNSFLRQIDSFSNILIHPSHARSYHTAVGPLWAWNIVCILMTRSDGPPGFWVNSAGPTRKKNNRWRSSTVSLVSPAIPSDC